MEREKEEQIEIKRDRKSEERSRKMIYTVLLITFVLLITSIILYLHLQSARHIKFLFMHQDKNLQDYDDYENPGNIAEYLLKNRPELEDTKINPFLYANLLNNENKCNESTEMLIAVTSAPNSFTQRGHIRWTWGQIIPNLETAFFLGNENDTILNLNLIEENKFHKDIIQGDYEELRYQQPRVEKVMHILKWTQEFCPYARFVLLLNESSYLEPENLKRFSKSLNPEEAMIIGHLHQPMKSTTIAQKPSNRPKYNQNQDYPFEALPDFIKGPTLLSRAAVTSIVEFMEYIYPKQSPEIFLGNLAMNLNIPIEHDELFHGEKSHIYSDIIASEGYGEVDDLLLEWRKHHHDNTINR